MDERRFDELSRRLAAAASRRAGLKAALAAVLGGAAGAAALEAEARKRRGGKGKDAGAGKRKRKKCDPACAAGQRCVKGACACENGGAACGAECCAIGQACRDGACAGPAPQCIAAGEPCKGTGRACCDGRVCASGQGGYGDVACYAPKTGACTATADCVYGMRCQGGRCAPPAPVEQLGGACDQTSQQLCAYPGAVCTAYDGQGSPDGTYCTLPLGAVCTGDPDCTCYKCAVPNGGASGTGRSARDGDRLACCGPAGYTCRSDRNCCAGTTCMNGQCGCTPSFAVTDDPVTNGRNLQAAINAMQDGDTLLLAPGIYQADGPDNTDFQSIYFSTKGYLPGGVEVPLLAEGGTYTLARCGDGEVVLRDKGTGTYSKAVYIDARTNDPARFFTVELRDITVGSHFTGAPSECNYGAWSGGVTVQPGNLVLSGTSKITGACQNYGGLELAGSRGTTVVMKDSASVVGNVGDMQGGVRMSSGQDARLIMEDGATITGNYGMASYTSIPAVGGILLFNPTVSVSGATPQNVFGNFVPNGDPAAPCMNMLKVAFDSNYQFLKDCIIP